MNKSYVVCVSNEGYEVDLEVRKVYERLPDDSAPGWIRVIDESEEDYLFPADMFVAIDLPAEAREVF
jgi:hypothetical protein